MGEPAHKEGRERLTCTQKGRDTCTEIAGNLQTKGERRLHRKSGKTCKKEKAYKKRANNLHTKGESLEQKACKQKGKYTRTQSTRWWTKYLIDYTKNEQQQQQQNRRMKTRERERD